MQPTLNELSLDRFPSRAEARVAASELLQTLRAVFTVRGTQRVLRASEGHDALEIADGYPLSKWRNDPDVSADEKSFFRSIVAWTPAIARSRDGDALADSEERCVFSVRGRTARGLGAAYLTDAIAVSVRSHEQWESPHVLLESICDAEGELEEGFASARHASTAAHVEVHRAELEAGFDALADDGELLWKSREQGYPHLSLSPAIQPFLQTLGRNDPALKQIGIRLRQLDAAASRWTEGSFDHSSIGTKATPESKPTLEDDPGSRTFPCPVRGTREIFSWHVRTTGQVLRIYYQPIRPGLISVGHIGSKMSTSRQKI